MMMLQAFDCLWCQMTDMFPASMEDSENHRWMVCPVKFWFNLQADLMRLVGLSKVPLMSGWCA